MRFDLSACGGYSVESLKGVVGLANAGVDSGETVEDFGIGRI